jgi:hypothetical protein
MGSFRIVSAIYFSPDQMEIPGIEGYGIYTGKETNIAALKVYTGINKYMKKYNGMDPTKWFPDYDEDQPPLILFVLQNLQTEVLSAWYSWRIPASQGERTIVGDDSRERTYKWRNKVRKVPLDSVIQ